MGKTYKSGFTKDGSRNAISRNKTKRAYKRAYQKKDVGNGNNYKKFYERWKICDFSFPVGAKKFINKINPKNSWVKKFWS